MNDTQPARTKQTQLNHRHGWAGALICDLVRDSNHHPEPKKQ